MGFEIARGLASDSPLHVIACARDAAKGAAAVAQLVSEGVPESSIEFRRLDIDDDESISEFAAWFHGRYAGRLGALVNNAAIQIEAGVEAPPFGEQAAPTMHTNFYQTMALTEALRPELAPSGRLVFVASMAGTNAYADSTPALQSRVREAASASELSEMAAEFVAAAQAGTEGELGWAHSTYGASKMLLIAYARLLAREYAPSAVRVNACCPGFCAT